MIIKYSFLITFLLFSIVSNAQTKSIKVSEPLSESAAESVGTSSERLGRISNMLEQAVVSEEIPGAVALVARNGKIVLHKAFGEADKATGKKMTKDAIFRIASQTKAITSTAVMMLWEEGRFRLDDPIEKYIPEFKGVAILDSLYADGTYTTKPAKTKITIRHLLTHTSGLGYGIIDADERFKRIYQEAGVTDLFTTEAITIEQSVKKLAKLPLHHNPGEAFTYGEGLDVLGYFIEVISGMPLDQFFKTHIFTPLGMNDTWFYLPESKIQRLVAIHSKEDGLWIKHSSPFYNPNYPIEGAKMFFSGGAGLCSTAKDYAAFLQMYLNKGELNGIRLLSRTTVEFMMANQMGEGIPHSYGLAFGILDEPGHTKGGNGSIGTFSWGGYFNTQYFADPKEKTIGILLKQTREIPDETSWKFRLLVGQAIDD